jgi:hypothetical protein
VFIREKIRKERELVTFGGVEFRINIFYPIFCVPLYTLPTAIYHVLDCI